MHGPNSSRAPYVDAWQVSRTVAISSMPMATATEAEGLWPPPAPRCWLTAKMSIHTKICMDSSVAMHCECMHGVHEGTCVCIYKPACDLNPCM